MKSVFFQEYFPKYDHYSEVNITSDYFGAGKKWHDPHVDRMFKHYEEANIVCKSIGINIYNATIGGKLEVFPRVNYLDLFNKP